MKKPKDNNTNKKAVPILTTIKKIVRKARDKKQYK